MAKGSQLLHSITSFLLFYYICNVNPIFKIHFLISALISSDNAYSCKPVGIIHISNTAISICKTNSLTLRMYNVVINIHINKLLVQIVFQQSCVFIIIMKYYKTMNYYFITKDKTIYNYI